MFDAFDDDDLNFDDNQILSDCFLKPDSISEGENTNSITINVETECSSKSVSKRSTNSVFHSTRNVSDVESEVPFEEFFDFTKDRDDSKESPISKRAFCVERGRSEQVVSPIQPKEVIQRVKRKFPGPAGVLPLKRTIADKHRSPRLSKYNSSRSEARRSTDTSLIKPNNNELICCTQSSQDVFHKKPWLTMKRDLEESNEVLVRLDKFNVADILKKASRNLLPSLKAPLLCVLLQSINFSGEYASAVFRDPSGEMSGWVDRLILKKYGSWFQPGCVLVLRQTSILSVSSRKHYLNVHPTNIVQIYRSDCEDDNGQVVLEKTVSNRFWNDLIREAEETLSKSSNVVQTPTLTCKEKRPSDKNSVLNRLQSYSAANGTATIEDVCQIEKPADKPLITVQRPQLRATSIVGESAQRQGESSATFDVFNSLDDDLWNDDEFDILLQHVETESQSEAK